MENEMKSQPAVLHMTVQVTRADTGETETHQLIGTGLTVDQCRAAGIVEAPAKPAEE